MIAAKESIWQKQWLPSLSAGGICIALTLELWKARTGGHRTDTLDLVGSLIIVVATVAIGWFAARFLTADRDRRGLIALISGLWGLTFNTMRVATAAITPAPLANPFVLAIVWTVLCALVIWAVSFGKARAGFATRAITFSALFLLVRDSFEMLPSYFEKSIVDAPVDKRDGKTRDVFVIILDKYTSGAWMRRTYGVDTRPFEDSLRALGFVVPPAARANYSQTPYALASFLNWRYLDDSGKARNVVFAEALEQIDHARVWNEFRKRGYRIVAFPTQFVGTSSFPEANRELRWPGFSRSPLGRTWLLNSPLARFIRVRCDEPPCPNMTPMPYNIESVREIKWKFATVASLPDSAGPVFTFLHVLSPHEPYQFNSDCSTRDAWWPMSDQGAEFAAIGKAYGNQVKCLNRLVLGTVRSLIRRSKVLPVIIITGDHGQGRIAVNHLRGISLTFDEARPEQVGEHLGIFAAYLFPAADTTVYADISPVNVMPLVLNSLFGEGLPLQPDHSYWASWQDPTNKKEIAPNETRPAGTLTSIAMTKRSPRNDLH
ncbi:MAG: hypothetical protein ABR582_14920 [Gemmatimonadaceae bacterium]